MISSSLVGRGRRFGREIQGRIGLLAGFYGHRFGCGRVFENQTQSALARLTTGIFMGGIILCEISRDAISRCAAVGSAAAELMDGVLDGALQAGFLPAEAVQETLRIGITSRYEGEAAVVVKVAIPVVVPDKAFVFVLVEGGFHALNARAAPGGHGDLADEGFFGGGGGFVFGIEAVEEGFESGWILAGQDESFGVQTVLEAVETDGGASFGRGWARAFLRVQAVSFDL